MFTNAVEGYGNRVFEGDIKLDRIVEDMRHPIRQTFAGKFRNNARQIGKYLAMEVVLREKGQPDISYREQAKDNFIMAIMRAAMPMVQGTQEIYSESPVGFALATRVEGTYDTKTGNIDVITDLSKMPEGISLEGRTMLVPDIMLASGRSAMNVYDKLINNFGTPTQTIFMASIAAKPGIEYLLEQIPGCNIYAAAIDPELDDRGFIVPGLGDAGNLCYNGGMSHLN